ncbi:unnamed protein product [Candidula unifasciata]|uniref:Mitochondria-eating protein n=1 Tax=Candidula unifasciata TaxID=100452 RepID=A0A8S3ZBX5_9EUPU|nr:unnamed protein product [Candidula unifasciata]
MSGDIKKDIRTEARNFSASLTSVFLGKKRDPQSKHLLEKAQQLIDGLLAEAPSRPSPATPPPRISRGGAGMGQLWVKLDELKRENDDLKRHRGRSSDDKAGSPKSPKSPKTHALPSHVDTSASDLQRLKHENDALKTQVEKLQKNLKEHQAVNTSLQDEYKRLKVALEAAQKSAMKAREDTKKLESGLKTLKAENEAIKHKTTHTQAPTKSPKPSISSPKPRARTDNRLTENISERCRPSNIAVAYTTLESQEWMDAKERLEEYSDDEESITKFLCDLLLKSFQASTHVIQSVETIIAHILANPVSAVSLLAGGHVTSSVQLSDEVSDFVCQKLRASFDNINTQVLAELTKEAVDYSSPVVSHFPDPSLQNYVRQCGALTWQMVLQKPPMKLCCSDSRFDEAKHKLWWSCDQSKAKKINYFIWPVLYDYEGGNLMVKGCVHAS